MGRLTPNSTIKLYRNIKSSGENNERIIWSSSARREAYFASHCVYTKTPVQIVKKTGQIKISLKDLAGTALESCNYLSFQNPHYDNKLYYARILTKDYVNNECALVTYEIDWWITDMFNITYDAMHIEREHMSQADATKASTNPYDGTILEMRTAEPGLPVSEDVQKLNYNIGLAAGSDNEDGVYVMQAIAGSINQDRTAYIMYLSLIDFANIDITDSSSSSGSTSGSSGSSSSGSTPSNNTPTDPETWFNTLLSTLGSTVGCFYVEPNKVQVHSGDVVLNGRAWSNKLPHPYYVLGFSSTYEASASDYSMKVLIDKLTSWNCVSSIMAIYGVPLGYLPFFVYTGDTQIGALPGSFTYRKTGMTDVGNKSPKLACYPFSYLEITSPGGDVKEYKYENFKSVRDGQGQVSFYSYGDLAEKPRLAIVPYNYKKTYTQAVQNPYGNFDECIMFEQFATAAYITDAWLAQIAAVSSEVIKGNTTQANYNRQIEYEGQVVDSTVGAARDFIGIGTSADVTSVAGGVDAGLGFIEGGGNYAQTMTKGEALDNRVAQIKSAYSAITGDYENSAIYDGMIKTRPAYVAHQYHKGNGDGTILMNTAVNADFCLTRVRLEPIIAQQYNYYFQMYGYASGRLGIPRFVNYIAGSSDASQLPDWQTKGSVKYTYIKTNGAKVICEDYEAELQIASILDKGVRLLKGDELS